MVATHGSKVKPKPAVEPYEQITLPDGRTASVVPADDAGEFRLVIDAETVEPVRRALALLGCRGDMIEAAVQLRTLHEQAYRSARRDKSHYEWRVSAGITLLEETIDERAYRAYRKALQASQAPRIVAGVVIDGRPPILAHIHPLRQALILLARHFGLQAQTSGRLHDV